MTCQNNNVIYYIIWSTDTSVSFETILIILAKISDLHIVV
uniref:Uncharacterized protein n=1 Tax=Myoviridae sp. ctP6q2 TaxID=2825096 RepID=A0A8S5UUN1_9CAUD|nr:MAG TPA: hypothetical protein [Myoviridae sp. ctP6q2]